MPRYNPAFLRSTCRLLPLTFLAGLFLSACSGGSGSNGGTDGGSGGGGSQSSAPTSGEYLWEVTSVQPYLSYATINTSTGALSAPVATTVDSGDPENYQGIVIAPSGEFLYELYWNFGELEAYQLTGPGFQLQQPSALGIAQSVPYVDALAMHPSGEFLYAVEDGFPPAIQEFSISATTGALTPGSPITENADLRMGVFDPTGKYLLVNDLTGGRIFFFQVNQIIGSLSPSAGSPFTLPSNEQPTYLAFGGPASSPFLYANLYSGGVAGFAFNSTSGTLTAVPSSPFQTASEAPDYICVDPSGKYLYGTSSTDGAIDGFVINPATGALSPVPGSPFATAPSSDTIAIDPSGEFLYVTNYEKSAIYGFSLGATTGSLSPLAGSPFASVPAPVGLTMMNIN